MSFRSTYQSYGRSAFGFLWRILVVGLGYTLAVMIGGVITEVLSLPIPPLAAGVDPFQMLVVEFVSGLLIGLCLGPLSARLTLPLPQRAGVLFVVVFILNSLINVIEALFFTTMPVAEQLAGLVTSAVGHVGLALLLAFLFRPAAVERGLLTALRGTLGQRRWLSWTWRFFAAGALYFPIYFFFGMLISPIVAPYYFQMDMGLTVPGFEVIVPLELFRGLLYALTLFLLIATVRGSRRSVAFWVILTLCVLGSWAPMLMVAWWPATLRVTHGVEITADCIVHGLLVVWLLLMPEAGSDADQRSP